MNDRLQMNVNVDTGFKLGQQRFTLTKSDATDGDIRLSGILEKLQ